MTADDERAVNNGTPTGVSGSRRDPTHRRWWQWRPKNVWQSVVAPLLVTFLAAGGVALVARLRSSDPESAPRMAAPVVVRNPTAREESVGAGDEMRQTRESMPTIELVVHNVGEATVVLHRAQFTVRGHGILQNCHTGEGAPLPVSATYDIALPLEPQIGDRVESEISHQLAPNEADRIAFGFGNPELGAETPEGHLYLLDVALVHGRDEKSLDFGSVLISLPGTPSLAVVGPSVDTDPTCVDGNRELVALLSEGDVTLSPELDELVARIAR